jgi:hypothetical protein
MPSPLAEDALETGMGHVGAVAQVVSIALARSAYHLHSTPACGSLKSLPAQLSLVLSLSPLSVCAVQRRRAQ